ncbi:hypothetical protein WOLCODRAFT_153238 [Wolfiporia cocos MD-104 SS10]|uniref:Pentacotripeptide-repeat region of PRORP domain-containing protein n=1 Tax=Wolfiporia cocos (strain MD-104) TaxID=742152 RepID=A0A2H3JZ69_WOLCO|nr:hypothetical protein WOLCODRAFT_153238 [Wolfiporia cocos MD-104 SS10]
MRDDQALNAKRNDETERHSYSMVQSDHSDLRELSELEEKVLLLQETAESEEALSQSTTYSEEELLALYEDLLSPPLPKMAQQNKLGAQLDVIAQEDHYLVQVVAQRILDSSESASTSSVGLHPPQVYTAVIARLQEVVSSLDDYRVSSAPDGAEQHLPIATGFMTASEWAALICTCIRANSNAAAETVLDLMKRSGVTELEAYVNDVLAAYANIGDVASAERILQTYAPSPSEPQRDLHVKAHIKALTPDIFPDAPLAVLHDYEIRGIPAPQKSYTRAIASLLASRVQPSQAHAQAFDLFAHMRYVAHPQPDASLYTLMLGACAHAAVPAEPERALDLFTEMTVDYRLPPTQGAYAATAHALARSGEPRFVHHAFRLAREMLDAHRDARGHAAFRPDGKLFTSLLEGAKRIGDLARVRWILAEMVRESAASSGDSDIIITEKNMRHVFHAYAAYRPPFKRSAAPLVDSQEAAGCSPANGTGSNDGTLDSPVGLVRTDVTDKTDPDVQDDFASAGLPAAGPSFHFSHLPPQSSAEVISEARALFSRIVEDGRLRSIDIQYTREGFAAPSGLSGLFRHIRINARLLNAYLAVHYRHSPIEDSIILYRTLFNDLGIQRNATTFVEALERCSFSKPDEQRQALQFAQEVWVSWKEVEDHWRARTQSQEYDMAFVNARLVERANVAMVKMLTRTRQSGRALQVVREFAERYPPAQLLRVQPKHPLRSTQSVLVGPKPLIRLMSDIDVPDDAVPPLLTFTDIDILHRRLVALEDGVGISYLKWLCSAYEGSLRRRRQATVGAIPKTSMLKL